MLDGVIVVLLFMQTSAMPSIHLFLGHPRALYFEDFLCRSRDAIWLVCTRARCPDHLIRCFSNLSLMPDNKIRSGPPGWGLCMRPNNLVIENATAQQNLDLGLGDFPIEKCL
jgi:hypothetical protein